MDSSLPDGATPLANNSFWLFRETKPFPRWPVTLVLAVCISVAIGTSCYLLWAHLTTSPIAGCGGDGGWIDCEGVANSRWSLWFGIPVSALAIAIYVIMAATLAVAATKRSNRTLRNAGWSIVTAAAFAAGMSAVWLIGVQLFVLQHICLYCMMAHACGLIAAGTMIFAGPLRPKPASAMATVSFVGLIVLVVGQMLTRPPETFEIETFDLPSGEADTIESDAFDMTPPGQANESDYGLDDNLFEAPGDGLFEAPSAGLREAPSAGLTSPYRNFDWVRYLITPTALAVAVVDADPDQTEQAAERIAVIQGGAVKLKVADWPHIGASNAKYVFVELFDYCCVPCRETFKTIRDARGEFGDELAIVLLPTPLSSKCNPAIKTTGPRFTESCELSKLAVAMWRVDQDKFAMLHSWMLSGDQPPTFNEALEKAETMVNSAKLKAELASGVPDQFIARHVALYQRVGKGSIPKLMFPRSSVVGKYTSVQGLIDLIRRDGN